MDYFTPIPEGQAIVCANGVYRQSNLAERAGRIHVRYGAGYVRLHAGGGTSHPKMKWYEIDVQEAGEFEERAGSVFFIKKKLRAA